MSKKFKKPILLVVLICFFVFSIFLYQSYFWRFFVKDGQVVKLVLKDNFFANQGKQLSVEVVKNENSTRRGLSNRSRLETADGQKLDGMLFIFSEAKIRYFWMKDMQFDIDICWLKEQSILDCTRRALKPDVENDEDLFVYQSPQAVDLVLETMPDFLTRELLGSKLYLKLF